MSSKTLKIFLVSVALSVSALPCAFAAEAAAPAKAVDLRLAMRSVWEGHIFWVRAVVISSHYGNKQKAKVAEDQVVQNAKDIGAAVAGFYGKEAGDKLFKLLAGHYGAVKNYMTAAFKNDEKGKSAAAEEATKNADEIAAFLSSANPNLPKATLLSLLTAHYGHHVTQINDVKANDWSGEARDWDLMLKQVDGVADALTAGIVKQFPDKF